MNIIKVHTTADYGWSIQEFKAVDIGKVTWSLEAGGLVITEQQFHPVSFRWTTLKITIFATGTWRKVEDVYI